LIGIGYAISEKLLQTLPHEERKLWSSLAYIAKSGLMVIPYTTDNVEYQLAQDLTRFYSKNFHFWQVDKGDVLPYGPP